MNGKHQMFHNLKLLATVFFFSVEFSSLSSVVDGSNCFPLYFFHGLLFFSHKKLFNVFSLLKQILTCQLVPKFHQEFATAFHFKKSFND